MAIAMKDLEIRGAGNLLGGEQSGHIADVGFDLYVRLVGEAVRSSARTAARVEQAVEVKIELPIDAHLPHDYIQSERLRLEMYKRMAEVRSDEDVRLLQEELARPLRHPAGPGRRGCSRWPASGPAPATPGSPRSPPRASTSASTRSSCPTRASYA